MFASDSGDLVVFVLGPGDPAHCRAQESRAAAVNDTAPDPLMSSKLANQSNRIAAYKVRRLRAS